MLHSLKPEENILLKDFSMTNKNSLEALEGHVSGSVYPTAILFTENQ